MIVSVAKIDCSKIHDWSSLHDEFSKVFGFPGFYGCNMSAWTDCMSYLDAPDAEMSAIHCVPGGVLTIQLDHVKQLKDKCPEQYDAIVECSAFVNWRRIERGDQPVLALSFYA
jgi:RNAse (barnase) inhibitor barstar